MRLRYFLRVTIVRQYNTNIVKEQEFFVQNIQPEPEINNPIKMEVGIEDALHLEYEFKCSKLHRTPHRAPPDHTLPVRRPPARTDTRTMHFRPQSATASSARSTLSSSASRSSTWSWL